MQPGIYRHYKGGEFLVFACGTNEADLAGVVLYQHLSGPEAIWVRPQAVFEEQVSAPEYGYEGPRFTYVREATPEDWARLPFAPRS
jgi:hypothetical protein